MYLQVKLQSFTYVLLFECLFGQYIYIIEGQELVLLVKDYIKYLFGADRSARLKSAMYSWGKFYKRRTRKKPKPDEYWLEKAILNTPTWWDHPDKYRYAIMEYLESQGQLESPASSPSSSSSSSSSSYDDEEYEESNSDDEQFWFHLLLNQPFCFCLQLCFLKC